jgi:hypothetical protein
MMNKPLLISSLALLITLASFAQKITYSQPEKNGGHSVDFNIIGKIDNHYLVYKHTKNSNNIFLYDKGMKLINTANMEFVPDKIVNAETILYKNYFYFVYQYQKDNVVSCAVAKMDEEGKIIGEPAILDTTSINFFMNSKIYKVLYSENKQKIMVYRISNKADTLYVTCSLFNEQLKLLDKFSVLVRMQAQNDFLSEIILDNDGSIAFAKVSGNPEVSKTQNISLVVKNPYDNNINTYALDIGKIYLNDIRVRADNLNNRFLVTGFYLKQRKGNIDGLYCAIWNKNSEQITVSKQIAFSDQLKNAIAQASSNTTYLQNIIMRKDGGFAVILECANSTNHVAYDNVVSTDYYSSTDWGDIVYSSSSTNGTLNRDYFAYNITLMSFDSVGGMEWSSIIPKNQYGRSTSNFIGYGTYQTPDEVNFLFNEASKKSTSMQSLKVNASGEIALNPTLKKLDRNYSFMPRFAKQVSSNEVLIPCQHKNSLCFAKIEF